MSWQILLMAGLLSGTWASSSSSSFLADITPRDAVTAANAETALAVLQKWYNTSTGLWIPSTGWWNSANCLTVVADLAAVDGNVKGEAVGILANTYTQAQKYNLQMSKVHGVVSQPWLPHTYYAHNWPFFPPDQSFRTVSTVQTSGFLNDYYDDEGWWALAWIAAYDATGNGEYLSQAEQIFADMYSVFGKTNCSTNSGGTGGIWWDKSHSYVNAIANELFLDVAAQLANRVHNGPLDYASIAKQQWAWFQGSGMINSDNTINDGLDQATCKNNGGTVWSYNQGVILGGLTELSKAGSASSSSTSTSYITTAQTIADAAMAALAPGGILKDPCEPNCGGDGTQFKGIFMRNLQKLQQVLPQERWATFLDHNADSIWMKDRNDANELSVQWGGPFVSPANASTQSSAMDALVAALAT